ncbi:MAG: sigma-70 family RNA polymerase sigma factor [Actinobacteria bacterium]|nr:sigma-70 family RNA polymerase sigma factor [Actinomycetota bacterium]
MFTQLYPQVNAYVRRRTPDDPADVVAEVFTTAWRRIGDVPDDALPWLLGVARRVLANARRAEARRPVLATVEGASPGGDPGSTVVERAEVARAFGQLSDGDREVLMLVAWDGLSPRWAARVVGCSVPTFYVRLHRARGRLARALEAPERATEGARRREGDS